MNHLHYQKLWGATADLSRSRTATILIGTITSKLYQASIYGLHPSGSTGFELILDRILIQDYRKLILFNRTGCVGLAIPYPDISVHALQRREDPATKEDVQTIYLQITKSNSFDDHDPDETISLTLFPASAGPSHEGTEVQSGEVGVDETSAEIRGPAMELFNAISACSSLHPGPASPSSSLEEGIRNQGLESDDAGASETLPSNGLPAAVPGSGGWITAENMHNFFDEEGNWRGGGLGRGAGITRAREDEGTNGDPSVEDSGGDTKWRRTD